CESVAELVTLHQAVLKDGEPRDQEVDLVTPEGHHVTLSVELGPVRDESGEVVGVSARLHDVSARRSSEVALRRREEEERQLQKMEALGRLASGITHDFNNFLTVILGYCDLILTDPTRTVGAVREDIEQIKHTAEQARALTKQILAFSRRQTLNPEVLSLNDVIEETLPLLQHSMGENIRITTLLEPHLKATAVDRSQLVQVLLNLAVNARDAMPHGGELTISTTNLAGRPEKEGPWVALMVTDTGVGMDAQTMSQIFEPFFTTKPRGAGTGLGLSTVYGIVKQSGGDIEVESEPGKGTRFTIYLPAVEEQLPQ
ncbi:MAG: PAS domain-containing protein, partial [Thermoleophilia bacterium]|nr:PAS domain-containing protein [Thermoleophilia bacterium]